MGSCRIGMISFIDKTGIKAYDIYGLTETSGPGVAFECEAQSGMHINEDNFIAEIIDPDTGEVYPDFGVYGGTQADAAQEFKKYRTDQCE